jgi:hypothetical protein
MRSFSLVVMGPWLRYVIGFLGSKFDQDKDSEARAKT